MRLLRGMTLSTLKTMPELSPVWFIFFFNTTLATLAFTRNALFAPDVTYNSHKNPEPYQKYRTKKYKYIDQAFDNQPYSLAPEY